MLPRRVLSRRQTHSPDTCRTETLRPKYGAMYGFNEATPPNAEMVAWTLFEYR